MRGRIKGLELAVIPIAVTTRGRLLFQPLPGWFQYLPGSLPRIALCHRQNADLHGVLYTSEMLSIVGERERTSDVGI